MRRALFLILFLSLQTFSLATTFYVRSGGSDAADGLSYANAWQTLQYSVDNASGSGDVIRVCGTLTPSAQVDIDTNPGSAKTPQRIIGANASDGSLDGSLGTISGASLPASTDMINLNLSTLYILFQDMVFTGATQYNIISPSALFVQFNNCRITGASSHGYYHTDASGITVKFYDCEIDSNGGRGYSVNASSRGKTSMFRCSIHDNTSDGVYESCSGSGQVYPNYNECLIYDNGATGLTIVSNASTGGPMIKACTIYGNTGDGLNLDADLGFIHLTRNIFQDNGGYGIDTNSSTVTAFSVINYTASYNNTSGDTDLAGGIPGTLINEDASFTSIVDGSEDLTPTNTNYKLTISLPAGASDSEIWLGGVQPPESAGGGDKWPYRGMKRIGY